MAGGDAGSSSTLTADGVAQSPSVSRYAWFRRRPGTAVATGAAPPLRLRGGAGPSQIVLADDDFVVCDHPGCGALRPVVTAGSFAYCPGCGRL